MKILLVSDVESDYIWHFTDEKLKDIDFTISCGDLKSEYLRYIATMTNKPVLYVHGNHDDHYITNEPSGCDSIDGQIFMFKGLRILGLGGCRRYKNGYFQYTDKEMNKRYKRLKRKLIFNKHIDLLVTHSPAKGLGDGEDFCHKGFSEFNEIIDKYKPKYHFHGHYHLNYGNNQRIINYKDTIIINCHDHYIIEI